MLRLLAFLCLLTTLLLAPQASAQSVDLVDLKNTVEALQRENANLTLAVEREGEQNARLLAQLDESDTTLSTAVTFAELRQAQFEVATARTRILTLDHRINEQGDRIDALNLSIVRLNATLNSDSDETLSRLVNEETLALRTAIRDEMSGMRARLIELRGLLRENANLRAEHLAILQRAVTLEAVEGFADASAGPLIDRINTLVDRLSNEALDLSNAASAIAETNPAAVLRRNLLRLRADELLLRSNARLTDSAIVEARAVVDALSVLPNDNAVPVRLLDDAVFALDARSAALRERRLTNEASTRAVDNLSTILTDQERVGGGVQTLVVKVDGLRDLLSVQRTELEEIEASVAELRTALIRAQTNRERSALFERVDVRLDENSRMRIWDEVQELPSEIRSVYDARLAEVMTAVQVATPQRLGLFALACLVLIAVAAVLRQKVLRKFIENEATRATELPLEVLRRNLFWLLPLGLWALFAQFFAISRETASSLYPLLAIPAAAALLRDFTSVVVTRRTTARQRRIGRIITRCTEVAMVLTATVVFAYFVLAELPLLPSTQSAINRMAYSVFVLAAMPMLLFVFFFAASDNEDDVRRGITFRGIIAGALSLLPPLALIATGVAGLAGYRDLAALLLEELGTAIAIAAILALTVGILADTLDGITGRIRERDPTRAYFVQTNFLRPLYRVAQVILFLVAVRVAANVFEWTSDTPVIRDGLALWRTVLFSVGEQPYTVGNVAIGLLALMLVFWLGAWSRRIAYSVLLNGVRDIGIRQSLSTFAQYVVIVIGVLLTLSAIGFDVTTLTVFAASLGVGIGFGLQNVVNNFISGILLLVERPLRIGDIVTVGGHSGTVSQIGIRSMRMRTFDEFDLVVPNSQLISETFTNWTRSNSLMRVLITVGIGYGDTPEEAVAIVTKVLQDHRAIVRNPEPLVTVDEFGDNSVNLRVCYYVDLRGDTSGFVVRSEVLAGIWREFGKAGISIPFPQRDIHVISAADQKDTFEAAKALVADEAPRQSRQGGDPADFASDAIDKALSGD